MPSVLVELRIEHAARRKLSGVSVVYLENLSDFWHIVDLGFVEVRGKPYGDTGGALNIRTTEGDMRLTEVFSILEKNGYRLSERGIALPAKRDHEFSICRLRTFSKQEIASADLLYLSRYRMNNVIADTHGEGDDESGWFAEANERLEKKLDIGCGEIHDVVFFSERLKRFFEESDLQGLAFVPVRYEARKNGKLPKPARQLWQFTPGKLMSPCLTELMEGTAGGEYDEETSDGALWLDGGYHPPELRFRRNEVEAMGVFDVALTRERTGIRNGLLRRTVIVTQRFRELLEKHKIRSIGYEPVRLID